MKNQPDPRAAGSDPARDRARWQRLSALLDEAFELSPESRPTFLDAACGGDLELRRQVEELLAADAEAGGFLSVPAAEGAASLFAEIEASASDAQTNGSGRMLGAYRLLGELGEGGMAVVYLAERADGQFEQQVALKLLKQGVHGDLSQRRFLQERQILARLQHPAIARLLDGGVTPDGIPFFAMERVEGVPVTEYCREQRLKTRQILGIFLEICDAVQYAHRNLIVHRDLKPSNILVDAAGHVKLLDFGIAKLLAEGSAGATAESTRTLVRALTPEYAAPEQILDEPVTTATDVYSLGVVLYELLTGARPYPAARTGALRLEQSVLEHEPARPSGRVASRERARELRGDLDWIVLNALQKEPERRYPSAEALVADLRRHLEGQPVSARRDTVRYRASKFVRRHRLGAAAAALVLLTLAGGLVATTWQARRAEREARKADAVKEFLKSLFAASAPSEAQGANRTARELLDDGARRIEADLKDQPEVQSEVARLIAATYEQLGEYDQALRLLQADLERRRRDGPGSVTAAALAQLADVYYDQGRYAEARPLYEEALAIQRDTGGKRTPEVAALLWDLGGVKRNSDDLAGAEATDREALQIFVATKGDDSREATWVRESLAIICSQQGRTAEAAAMQTPVAAWRQAHDGLDHPETINARYNLATYLLRLGQIAEAARIEADVVERQRRVLGPRHDRLAAGLRVLARARYDAGDAEAARPLIAEALSIHRERFGRGHLQVAIDLAWQALIESGTGRIGEAEKDARDALRILASDRGTVASDLAAMRFYTGSVLAEVGRDADAEVELTQAIASFRSRQPAEALLLGYALDALADIERRTSRTDAAARLAQEAVAILDRNDSKDHPAVAFAHVRASAARWADGHPRVGEPELRSGLDVLTRLYPNGHAQLAGARFLLGDALARSGRASEARPFLEAALEWRESHFGAQDPRTLAARRSLELSAKRSPARGALISPVERR